MSFRGKFVQVRERILDQALADTRRTWQILDGIVVIEEKRMCELPNIRKTALRPLLFCFGNCFLDPRVTRFPAGCNHATNET